MEWGKEEEKECEKAGLSVIATNVALKDGRTGRIIRVKADAGGKIGAKVYLCCTMSRSNSV
jgi:N-acetyltransferase